MKVKIVLPLLLIANTLMVMAQHNSGNIYEMDIIRDLSREEIYQKFAYDDTSRALIDKYYSSHTQAAVLGGVGAVLTAGGAALTYVMIDALSYYNFVYLVPFIALTGSITIVAAAGSISSIALVESRARLLTSLKYYKENGELTQKDRRWIQSYLPKQKDKRATSQ